MIASADTLVHSGDLAEVSRAARIAQRPGGRLVFAAERIEETEEATGSRLSKHGRYRHNRESLEFVLVGAGVGG